MKQVMVAHIVIQKILAKIMSYEVPDQTKLFLSCSFCRFTLDGTDELSSGREEVV